MTNKDVIIQQGLSRLGYLDGLDSGMEDFDEQRLEVIKELVLYLFQPSTSFFMEENSSDIRHYINKYCRYSDIWEISSIEEGELIMAMYRAGFDCMRNGKRVYFKITEKSCRALYSEANKKERFNYSLRD